MFEKAAIVIALFLTALTTLVLFFISWRRRSSGVTAVSLSVCLLTVAIYCFGYAMEIQCETLEKVMFWVRFQHWGIDFIAPTWLLFSLAVSGYEKRITRKLIIAIFLVPVVLFLMSQTLGWLNLGHHNPSMDYSGSFPVFTFERTSYNYVVIGYYSLCLICSLVFYLIMFFRYAPSFRNQAVIYLIGCLPPWLALILHNLNLFPSNIDYTPLALAISGALFTYGFFKYKILDIIPMARDLIFENMKDGVLILNMENRVMDYNPAFKTIFPCITIRDVGSSFSSIFSTCPSLLKLVDRTQTGRIEYQTGEGDDTSFYRVDLSMIVNKRGQSVGKIISFYEFTDEKRLMEKLERLAATDGLTGIYNRQHFDRLVRKEISRIGRYGGKLSLIMLDLDRFKSINDTYGHMTGDEALVAVVNCFKSTLRDSDILARFGGEEFLILAPNTEITEAKALAERLRLALETRPIRIKGLDLQVLASFGVTSVDSGMDVTPERLYHWADKGTYAAKALGGNAVCVFLPSDGD